LRWRLYIEEYSPELQYIEGTHNVVANALSWLDMDETPLADTQESFLGLLECFGLKQPDETDFHPLNFKHLLKTQESDKTIMNMLAMENTKCVLQDFHGGGKTTALICYRNKIVSYQTNYKKQSYPGTTQLSVTLELTEQKKQ
jgi:hypothetical protein